MFLKSPIEGCAWVIATKDIQQDEEIFVDYGKWYWAMLKPTKLSHFRHNQLVNSLSKTINQKSSTSYETEHNQNLH